jgi:hypothetical protein
MSLKRRLSRILIFIFSILSYFFVSCSSDKQGDEIGAIKNNGFPESYDVRKNEIFISNGLNGPEDKSVFGDRIPTSWSKFSSGSISRLAILLTDTSASWLGIAHGLKSIGIPFTITTDYHKALQHNVVIVYPVVSGASLPPDALKDLAAFPRNGGTLIGIQVLGGLNEIFGFEEAIPSKQHFEIKIPKDSSTTITGSFVDPKELEISLGNKEKFKETMGTYSYSKTQLPPVATYEDKSAAITQKFYETGSAYAFGFDIGFLILKGHNIRHQGFNRSPINNFEPTIDVVLRLIKNIYLKGERDASYISTVPYNKSLSVCITHNINFSKALSNAVLFAKEEQKMNVHSTYFIQTKYIRDNRARIFNSNDDFDKLKMIKKAGMDIQSNTVSGSPLFDQFEQGTGDEVYPAYRPYVMNWEKTYHGTIFGEMRVGRFLIDHFVPGNNTTAFRSSYLYTPFTYPQSLLSCGYRFSSSVPANEALTHFPFQLNYNREYDSEVQAFEFPVTDDDEVPPYTLDRAQSAISLAKKIATYGGCYIGQVHPNAKGLIVEKKFVDALSDDAWFGTINDFGLWWAARNEVTLDINYIDDKRIVTVNVPKRMEGLAIMLPVRSTPVSVEGGGKYSVDGKLIIFELAEGVIKMRLSN